MTLSLTISGTERKKSVRWDSLRIENVLTRAIDTCRFTMIRKQLSDFKPTAGKEVIVTADGTRIFGGVIIRVTEKPVAYGAFDYEVEAVDYGRLLDSKLVAKTYQDQTVNTIIADLKTSYFPSGFTTTKVSCTTVIKYVKFNYLPMTDCLTKLAELTGYDWYIDYNKDLYFDIPDPTTAPVTVADDTGTYEYDSLVLRDDNSQVRNTIYVRGGEYLGAAFSASIVLDGKRTSVELPYRFDDFACSITGTKLKLGTDNTLDDFTLYDALYNFDEKTVKLSKAYTDGAVFSFSGKPHYPVRVKLKSQDSIDETLSAEGVGDGVYEYLVIEKTLNSKDGARQRARAEINTYAQTMTEGEFITETAGFSTGQKVRINSTSRGVDKYYIVNKVSTFAQTPDRLKYHVSMISTKTFGFIELLRRLLRKETEQIEVSDDETIDLMESADETITFSETFTADLDGDASFTETATMAETFTAQSLDYDVEFVLGAFDVPTGKKRVFLLGGSVLG